MEIVLQIQNANGNNNFDYSHNVIQLWKCFKTHYMIKISLFTLALMAATCALSQELSRENAFINKVKRVQQISLADYSDTITYNYDIRGLLMNITGKPSPYLYPPNSSRVTSFFYQDTLLQMKLTQTYIGDTLFKTDSVLYSYDAKHRLISTYQNYVDNIPTLQLNTYIDFPIYSYLARTSSYNASRPQTNMLSVPTTIFRGMVFYLQSFKVFSGLNVNHYAPCLSEKSTGAQAFCKSKLERVIVKGDSLRQIFTINGYSDLGSKNELLFNDTAYFTFGDHNILAVTTEKLYNGMVMERNISEYDGDQPSLCKSSYTQLFTYRDLGLVSEVRINTVEYFNPRKKPSTHYGKILYEYTFYDR